MNPEDYVPYPLALALKKAGFDWECDHYWYKAYANSDEMSMRQASADDFNNDDWDVPHCSAPTLWQAQKWLRDIKRLSIEPYANIAVAWNYNIADLDNFAENVGGEASFPSYESALSAGIAAALELIEKKGK